MSTSYTFTRCIQLSKAAIIEAAASRGQCKALLEHLSRISRPNDGAPLVLLLLARLATVACDWLEGDLRVELEPFSARGYAHGPSAHGPSEVAICDATRVTVMVEMGGGFREKIFSGLELSVPLDELTSAVDRIPQMVFPLLARKTANGLVLTATEEVRTSTVAPAIVIDEAFLRVPRPPALPNVSISPGEGGGECGVERARESPFRR